MQGSGAVLSSSQKRRYINFHNEWMNGSQRMATYIGYFQGYKPKPDSSLTECEFFCCLPLSRSSRRSYVASSWISTRSVRWLKISFPLVIRMLCDSSSTIWPSLKPDGNRCCCCCSLLFRILISIHAVKWWIRFLAFQLVIPFLYKFTTSSPVGKYK